MPDVIVIPLLDIHPEKNVVWKDTHTLMFTAALFPRAEDGSNLPINRKTDKEDWCIYIMERCSAITKWKNNVIGSNMDGPCNCHAEWIKSEKDKYHMTSLTYHPLCAESKNQMNSFIKQKQTPRLKGQTYGCHWFQMKMGEKHLGSLWLTCTEPTRSSCEHRESCSMLCGGFDQQGV